MAKRFFALLIVLVMVLALAVGCGEDPLKVLEDDILDKIGDLQGQIDDLYKKNEALEKENAKLKADLAEKQTAIEDLTDDLTGLSLSMDLYTEVVDSLILENLSDNLDALQALSGVVAETYDTGKLVILHSNDIHGRLLATASDSYGSFGLTAFSALRRIYEKQGYNVLLVDAGDAIQGTSLVNVGQGEIAVDFMNSVGFDVAVPGNHEFDWGFDNFMKLVDMAKFPYISLNMVYSAVGATNYNTANPDATPVTAGDRILTPDEKDGGNGGSIVKQIGGVRIGFIGITTPETATKAHPDKTTDVSFIQNEGTTGKALNTLVQNEVTRLKQTGENKPNCDIVVVIGHMGIDEGSQPNRSTDIIAGVRGIDVFIDGHSHDEIENKLVDQKTGTGEILQKTTLASTGEHTKNVGVITFDKDNAPTSHLIKNDSDYADGVKFIAKSFFTDISNRFAAVNDDIERALSVKVGSTAVSLAIRDADQKRIIRNQETNLGNFAADALLWSAQKALGTSVTVHGSLTNGGGIREPIAVGDITMKDMVTVFPFGNTVVVISVTGEQLWEAIEAASHSLGYDSEGNKGESGGFAHVAGIKYKVDTTKEWTDVEANKYPSGTYYKPSYSIDSANKRVTIESVGGAAFSKTAVYNIATNDFVAAGGDQYYVFKSASKYTDIGIGMEDAMINYLQANATETFAGLAGLAGTITAAKYPVSIPTANARITIIYPTAPAA